MTNIPKSFIINLPDEQLQPLVTGGKAKLAASGLGDGGLKKLF